MFVLTRVAACVVRIARVHGVFDLLWLRVCATSVAPYERHCSIVVLLRLE